MMHGTTTELTRQLRRIRLSSRATRPHPTSQCTLAFQGPQLPCQSTAYGQTIAPTETVWLWNKNHRDLDVWPAELTALPPNSTGTKDRRWAINQLCLFHSHMETTAPDHKATRALPRCEQAISAAVFLSDWWWASMFHRSSFFLWLFSRKKQAYSKRLGSRTSLGHFPDFLTALVHCIYHGQRCSKERNICWQISRSIKRLKTNRSIEENFSDSALIWWEHCTRDVQNRWLGNAAQPWWKTRVHCSTAAGPSSSHAAKRPNRRSVLEHITHAPRVAGFCKFKRNDLKTVRLLSRAPVH